MRSRGKQISDGKSGSPEITSPGSTSPKTVLCVVASLRGGAAAHALTLAEGLRRLGWRVVLVAPDDCPSRASRAYAVCDAWEKLPLDEAPPTAQAGSFDELILRHAPVIIHAHGIRAGFTARFWALSRKLNFRRKGSMPHLVYTIHGFHPEFVPNSFRRWLGLTSERVLNRAARRIVVISPSDRELILKRKLAPESKIRLIPNAIDPIPFRQPWSREHARAQWQIPEDAFVIGTLSRLHRQKAVHVLIDAAGCLHHFLPKVVVLIAGEGPLREDLEEQTKKAGLTPNIRFLGEIPDPTLFYRALDAFCLTSLWEGLPLVILEAAAVDVPIVATQVPGTTDILRNEKNALLVPPNNPQAFADAVLRFQRDPAFAWKLAAAATRELEAYFDPDKMCREVADVYADLLGQETATPQLEKTSSPEPQ